MNDIIKRFCPRYEFNSYEDMKKNFKINAPEDFNFGYDVVDAWADIEPEKLALVWTDESCVMKRFTFKDIKEESNRVANFFTSRGIKKGDVVMLILKQRVEVWTCLVALHKIGAIAIPATFQLQPHDLIYRLQAANVKMIVTIDDDFVVNTVKASLKECPSVENYAIVGEKIDENALNFREEIKNFGIDFPRQYGENALKLTDTMLVYFSSGTTGMPKMVRHDHSWALGHITTARFWQCVQENKIHMTHNDSGWAKFAWGKIYGQWICGAAVGTYDEERFDPHKMLEAVTRIKPTTFCTQGTVLRLLVQEDLSKYDFSFIEHTTLAGEALNPEVFNKVKRMMGLTIYEGFGQTETTVLFANFPWDEPRPGSMGRPSPIYNMELLDESGNRCEDGIVGSICVKNVDNEYPVGLFKEYWKNKEETERSFKFGAYNTGDTAWRDAEGYYWFVGRNDDVIKCSGYRIGPFEVESALMEHPSVQECAVTSVPDEIRGQIVKATIVLARGYEGSEELIKELQNHVKNATAPYKYPRKIEFVTELPKTVSGKIMRTAIRAADMQKTQNGGK